MADSFSEHVRFDILDHIWEYMSSTPKTCPELQEQCPHCGKYSTQAEREKNTKERNNAKS